jgi:hypothetical protein
VKTKRGRESVCMLRPEAIKTVNDWAVNYRRFWEESFDKLGRIDIFTSAVSRDLVQWMDGKSAV